MNLHLESSIYQERWSEHSYSFISLGTQSRKRRGCLFLLPPGPGRCPPFYTNSISEVFSRRGQVQNLIKTTNTGICLQLGEYFHSSLGDSTGQRQDRRVDISALFWLGPHGLTGGRWLSNILGRTGEVTQGTWEHLGESRASEWVGEGVSGPRRDLQSHSQGYIWVQTEPDVSVELVGGHAAEWRSFKHRQRGVPALALGLRPTVAHVAL